MNEEARVKVFKQGLICTATLPTPLAELFRQSAYGFTGLFNTLPTEEGMVCFAFAVTNEINLKSFFDSLCSDGEWLEETPKKDLPSWLEVLETNGGYIVSVSHNHEEGFEAAVEDSLGQEHLDDTFFWDEAGSVSYFLGIGTMALEQLLDVADESFRAQV